MAKDILSVVAPRHRPFWADVVSILQARREGWEGYHLALPIAARVIEFGGFDCSPVEFVETLTGVIDKRIIVIPADDASPSVPMTDPKALRALIRLAHEARDALRRMYPKRETP